MTEVANKKGGHALLWFFVLVLAGAVGFLGWNMQVILRDHHESTLQQTVDQQSQQIQRIQQVLKQYDQQFQQVAEHSNTLMAAVKSLDETLREGSPQWRYTQIQFYLERAAQETYVMKDPVAAQAWLQVALQNVNKLNQANLLPIQEAIQQDIQDLARNGGNATTQAMVSLSVMSDNLHTLPHKQAPEKMAPGTPAVPAANEQDHWRTALWAAWEDMKSLVRVRTAEGDIVPYLSNDEQSLVDQNVALALNQASFSAMRAQEDLYAHDIAQAILWINRYYDTTTSSVQEVLTTLDHLSKLSVTFTPPARLKSFDAWNQFLQQKEKPA